TRPTSVIGQALRRIPPTISRSPQSSLLAVQFGAGPVCTHRMSSATRLARHGTPPSGQLPGRRLVGDLDLGPVVADPLGLVVDHRQQRDRPSPDPLEVLERVAGVTEPQVDALVAMREQQLAAVEVVGLDHVDERLAEVGQLLQQRVLDLLELARLDLVATRAAVLGEGEEPVAATELEGEELVDEG